MNAEIDDDKNEIGPKKNEMEEGSPYRISTKPGHEVRTLLFI